MIVVDDVFKTAVKLCVNTIHEYIHLFVVVVVFLIYILYKYSLELVEMNHTNQIWLNNGNNEYNIKAMEEVHNSLNIRQISDYGNDVKRQELF